MKSKKRLFSLCLVLLLSLCIVGCGEAKTSASVGNKLNKQVENLSTVIDKMEDVNYNEIIINSLNPLSDNTYNTVSTKTLQKNKWYTVGNITSSNQTKPNAKYVNAEETKEDKIGLSDNSSNGGETYCENGSCYNTQSSSKYTPKYVNNVSESFVRTSLDDYISSIEVLYNDCADCISCEAECKNARTQLCQNIEDCKILCKKLKDGTISLSQSEIESCNDIINQIQSFTSRLSATKGIVKNKVSSVSKVKDTYSSNMESVKDAYQKLLEALETRLDCYNECNNAICNITDIINKTKVNVEASEKNKSDSENINENYNQNAQNVANKKISKINIQNKTQNNQTINNSTSTSQNTSQKNFTTNSNDTLDNVPNEPLIKSNYDNQTQVNQAPLTNQTYQNNVPNGNTANVPNGFNNTNGYNQYPYNGVNRYNGINNQYPNRNIDTYQNIIKNIDTYRQNPSTNYYNNYNQLPSNNLPVQNNLNMTNENDNDNTNKKDNSSQNGSEGTTNDETVKEVKLKPKHVEYNNAVTKKIVKNKRNNAPIPYPYDNKKIAEQNAEREKQNVEVKQSEKIDNSNKEENNSQLNGKENNSATELKNDTENIDKINKKIGNNENIKTQFKPEKRIKKLYTSEKRNNSTDSKTTSPQKTIESNSTQQ